MNILRVLGFISDEQHRRSIDTMALAYKDVDGNLVEAWHFTTQVKSVMPKWLRRVVVFQNDKLLIPPIGGFSDSIDVQHNQVVNPTDWVVCPITADGHLMVYSNELFHSTFNFVNTMGVS